VDWPKSKLYWLGKIKEFKNFFETHIYRKKYVNGSLGGHLKKLKIMGDASSGLYLTIYAFKFPIQLVRQSL
jgi:hypothetical protein